MKNIILKCKAVKYYSQLDEDAFFEWVNKIGSIVKYDGYSDVLHLHVKGNLIPDQDLREIIGLFHRYKINMAQLSVFLNQSNEKWFLDKPKGYWHKKVFGDITR